MASCHQRQVAPPTHPAVLLKIYIYGYLNRIQSSRRLERECQRNVELMWLTGRLAPDFKTIADFRRDNGTGIRNVCRRFVVLCRDLKLFSQVVLGLFEALHTGHSESPATADVGENTTIKITFLIIMAAF
jgi:hypothetical protein